MKRFPLARLCAWCVLFAVVRVACSHKTHDADDKAKKATHFDDEGDLPTDQHFFLDEIFDKYGDGDKMSFEGFEHLLENLGLGRLEFDKRHNVSVHRVNGTFREVHDILDLHQHHHNASLALPGVGRRRRRRARDVDNDDDDDDEAEYDAALHELESQHDASNSTASSVPPRPPPPRLCLSPQDMLLTFGLEPHHAVVINPLRFLKLCPAIVYELDQRTCYHREQLGAEAGGDRDRLTAWLYASLSVLAISLVGLLGVAVVPLVQNAIYKKFLHFLVALAVGTLCGDALLHLLPHALMSSHESTDHVSPVLRATATFLALTFFFFVEAMIKCIAKMNETKKLSGERAEPENDERARRVLEMGPLLAAPTPARPHGHQHNGGGGGTSTVAWMVIMGDGLHNLTDGLAIGAAFSSGTVAGFATTMAVFCHELPHEIGDFAVLLSSGMSVRRALLYNVFSSVLSFTGMAIGVWVGDHEEAALWIYAVTAGTFLYISLADLIPEMSSNLQETATPFDVLLQIAGICSGGGIMLAIALYEDSLRTMFDGY